MDTYSSLYAHASFTAGCEYLNHQRCPRRRTHHYAPIVEGLHCVPNSIQLTGQQGIFCQSCFCHTTAHVSEALTITFSYLYVVLTCCLLILDIWNLFRPRIHDHLRVPSADVSPQLASLECSPIHHCHHNPPHYHPPDLSEISLNDHIIAIKFWTVHIPETYLSSDSQSFSNHPYS